MKSKLSLKNVAGNIVAFVENNPKVYSVISNYPYSVDILYDYYVGEADRTTRYWNGTNKKGAAFHESQEFHL